MPVLRESVSIGVQSDLTNMNKSLLFVHKGSALQRLPGASVSLQGRFNGGSKKIRFLKHGEGENGKAVLIRMPLMCSHDGRKDARMDRNCIEKSKSRDTRDRNDRFIASWFHCARNSASFKRRKSLMHLYKIFQRKTRSGY